MNYLKLNATFISAATSSLWFIFFPILAVFGYDDVTARRLVRQGYCRVLERPVDDSGLVSYGGALRGSMTAQEMIFQLATSQEHRSRFLNKSTPEQYINILYEQLLNRSADPTGLNAWTNVLTNEGYVSAVKGIINSPEYKSKWGLHRVPGGGRAGCQ